MWVYKQSESGPSLLWTVGYYAPDGTWYAESDHRNPEEAARRVCFLNGGNPEPPHFNGNHRADRLIDSIQRAGQVREERTP